jgi:hypothetical protein
MKKYLLFSLIIASIVSLKCNSEVFKCDLQYNFIASDTSSSQWHYLYHVSGFDFKKPACLGRLKMFGADEVAKYDNRAVFIDFTTSNVKTHNFKDYSDANVNIIFARYFKTPAETNIEKDPFGTTYFNY